MFIVTESEGWSILNRVKVSTLRPIRANNKGYFHIGSIQSICIGRDFKTGIICRVYVIGRDFVSVEDLEDRHCLALGYSNRAEYLAQEYNQRQTDPRRVKYTFITLGAIRTIADSLGVRTEIFRGVINE